MVPYYFMTKLATFLSFSISLLILIVYSVTFGLVTLSIVYLFSMLLLSSLSLQVLPSYFFRGIPSSFI